MNPVRALLFGKQHFPHNLSVHNACELDCELIRIQLARILKSSGFVHCGRMRRFLAFVVEETLAGRRDQLCEYNVGVSVFDRGESFEPALDPIVRNDARRLRQKLLEYYQRPADQDQDSVLIEIPKGGYVPVFLDASPAKLKSGSYRLMVTLTRIADDFEVWTTEQELHYQ